MTTVQDTLDELQEKQHELAVFATVVEFLDGEFLPHSGTRAKRSIEAEGCQVPTVPEAAVESVRDLLMENHVGPLEKGIAALMSKRVK